MFQVIYNMHIKEIRSLYIFYNNRAKMANRGTLFSRSNHLDSITWKIKQFLAQSGHWFLSISYLRIN